MGWATFAFDESWEFATPPATLWAALTDTASFPRWWPWLRSFDPVPVEPGSRTRAVIGPPLPYVLTVSLVVVAVEVEAFVEVDVTGDASGPARLEVASMGSNGSRSTARLVWELEVARPLLRAGARVARPILQWGHDWVVTNGVEQFRRAALAGV